MLISPAFSREDEAAFVRALDRLANVFDRFAERLCDSGVPAWVAFGDHRDTGLTAAERSVLEARASPS